MEEITPPEREPQYYQCCCVFTFINNTEQRCDSDTGSPDRPFCDECEDRHPTKHNALITGVSAVLPTLERRETT